MIEKLGLAFMMIGMILTIVVVGSMTIIVAHDAYSIITKENVCVR